MTKGDRTDRFAHFVERKSRDALHDAHERLRGGWTMGKPGPEKDEGPADAERTGSLDGGVRTSYTPPPPPSMEDALRAALDAPAYDGDHT